MKPSKYFGTSEGLVELRPFKTDDGLTMYRPVTYPCPDGLERYQGFALQAGKFQTVVSLGIGADAEMIAHAPEDIAALVAEVERLRATVIVEQNRRQPWVKLAHQNAQEVKRLREQIDAVDGLHRKTPVYDTFADDCEEHDPEEHAIEGLDSSVAGPSTVSSIDW